MSGRGLSDVICRALWSFSWNLLHAHEHTLQMAQAGRRYLLRPVWGQAVYLRWSWLICRALQRRSMAFLHAHAPRSRLMSYVLRAVRVLQVCQRQFSVNLQPADKYSGCSTCTCSKLVDKEQCADGNVGLAGPAEAGEGHLPTNGGAPSSRGALWAGPRLGGLKPAVRIPSPVLPLQPPQPAWMTPPQSPATPAQAGV